MRGWVGVLMALVLAAPAVGQEQETRPSDALHEQDAIRPPEQIEGRSNAALEYFRIWDTLTRAERNKLGELAADVGGPDDKQLDKEARKLIAERRDYIDALIRAANSQDCVWGVRYEAGWMALLPHLGFLRGSCRVIRLDAFRCMADREYNAAAERVVAILHMSEQTRSDGVLISTLVGAAICEVGLVLTEDMIKRGELNPSRARMILAAEKAVRRDDLFGISESLLNEKAMAVDWPRQHYRGEHAGWMLMREMGMSGLRSEAGHSFVVGMNEQQMGADLDRFARYFDAVSAVWRKADKSVLLDELNTEVMEGQYGVIAMTMAPSMEKVAKSIDKTRADLDRVAAELEGIVHSEEGGAGK